ncbi:MAG TPA: Holliday junction branch migration DNA helicase RuvB [Lachnospiraceae bacterium]|nr:Holliday junction branch migration DNA helicase RuvB [Lachnospiraceae bacterium]
MATEKNFRPQTFDDYQGQEKAKKILKIAIKAAEIKGTCLDHVLLAAESGVGKTTVARIIANESGQNFKEYSGPSIKTVADITDILQQVDENDCILIDEIHSLKKPVQEVLFLAMENFTLNVNIDGEIICQQLPHFTIIGATTELSGLELPMRNRFQLQINLVPYTDDNMTDIVKNVFKAMKVEVNEECARLIAGCTRGVPRNANSYCRRVYDVALVTNNGIVNEEVVYDTFDLMDINEYGLNGTDMRYLQLLYDNRKSTGLDTIALALGTDKKSVETVIEPFLFKSGVATKGPRGRKITQKGVEVIESLTIL